jgi:hypothetical protein
MSRYGRPGGGAKATLTRFADGVELYIEDADHGGGMRLQWENPAWAQAWLDEVSRRLADLDGDDDE